jgi:hypothetical protein
VATISDLDALNVMRRPRLSRIDEKNEGRNEDASCSSRPMIGPIHAENPAEPVFALAILAQADF